MAEGLLSDTIGGYEVSTVRLDAGGGLPSSVLFFNSADYEDLNTWPFETMVFKRGSRKGLYHEAFASEDEARAGHARIVAAVTEGSLEWGKGVRGPNGTPSLTPDEWRTEHPEEVSSNATN